MTEARDPAHAPPGVRQMVMALVRASVARALQAGVSLEDYEAALRDTPAEPGGTVSAWLAAGLERARRAKGE